MFSQVVTKGRPVRSFKRPSLGDDAPLRPLLDDGEHPGLQQRVRVHHSQDVPRLGVDGVVAPLDDVDGVLGSTHHIWDPEKTIE